MNQDIRVTFLYFGEDGFRAEIRREEKVGEVGLAFGRRFANFSNGGQDITVCDERDGNAIHVD